MQWTVLRGYSSHEACVWMSGWTAWWILEHNTDLFVQSLFNANKYMTECRDSKHTPDNPVNVAIRRGKSRSMAPLQTKFNGCALELSLFHLPDIWLQPSWWVYRRRMQIQALANQNLKIKWRSLLLGRTDNHNNFELQKFHELGDDAWSDGGCNSHNLEQ